MRQAFLRGWEKRKAPKSSACFGPPVFRKTKLISPAKKTQSIGELDRRGSSCPVLFAWNGKEYEFIADMLGPGVVGHWVGPATTTSPSATFPILTNI